MAGEPAACFLNDWDDDHAGYRDVSTRPVAGKHVARLAVSTVTQLPGRSAYRCSTVPAATTSPGARLAGYSDAAPWEPADEF